MALRWQRLAPQALAALRKGVVIPAHPLALDADASSIRAASARSPATTSTPARAGSRSASTPRNSPSARPGFLQPVLELAMRTAAEWARRPPIMIAGLAGRTEQAMQEAQVARGLGYHAGLLSLAAMKGASEDELIAHAQAVAAEIPLVGFYLQPAVGGIVLPVSFWRRFAEIENVVAIKIAPFNRYRTLDVVRGVVEAGAADRVTLYTGNDDHIVPDLVTPYTLRRDGASTIVRIKGGLLGHWSVWVQAGGRAARPHPRAGRTSTVSGRPARARLAGDRLQRRDLRRRQRLSWRHRRLSRNPSPARPAGGHLVS